MNPASVSSVEPGKKQVRRRLPAWLKAELPSGENYEHLLKTVVLLCWVESRCVS